MLKNYIKIAVRNLGKNKLYTFINIIGLSVGISLCYMMMINVIHETSYDKYNKKLDRICRVISQETGFNYTEPKAPFLLAPRAKEQIPEIEKIARSYRIKNIEISLNDETFKGIQVQCIDPELFEILSFTFKYGHQQNIFSEKNSICLSEKLCKQIFSDINPIGIMVQTSIGNVKYDLKITGIYKDIPHTSTFKADCLLPMFIGINNVNERSHKNIPRIDDWSENDFLTYILCNGNCNIADIENKLPKFHEHSDEIYFNYVYHLQPLKEAYLFSNHMVRNRMPTGDPVKIKIFTIIAMLVLSIACINYILLMIAQTSKRTKEVGIRKIMGADRLAFIKQISLESVLLALLSFPFAWIVFSLFYQHANKLMELNIQAGYGNSLLFLILFVGLTIFVGSLTGCFTTFYIIKNRPVDILKQTSTIGTKKSKLQYSFVLLQMVIFTAMIFCTIVIYNQIQFFRNKEFGFQKEFIFIINLPREGFANKYYSFKNELRQNSNIVNVSAALELPPQFGRTRTKIRLNNNPDKFVTLDVLSVDYDFLKTMGMKLVKGRSFSKEILTDKDVWIINESALKEIGNNRTLENGKIKIIGVVNDFHKSSFHEKIPPTTLALSRPKYFRELVIRIKPGNMLNTIEWIKGKWREFNPDITMHYIFMDERLDHLYKSELNFSKLINYSTFIAILITCLGLSGLMMFIVEQRTKEIGIRKVVGASVPNILFLLSKDFLIWLLLANLIAWPLAWYAMNKWLQNFAYRIDLTIWPFLLAGLAALVIALLTISFQTVRAATANPVESLQYE